MIFSYINFTPSKLTYLINIQSIWHSKKISKIERSGNLIRYEECEESSKFFLNFRFQFFRASISYPPSVINLFNQYQNHMMFKKVNSKPKGTLMVLKHVYMIKRSLYIYSVKNFLPYPMWDIIFWHALYPYSFLSLFLFWFFSSINWTPPKHN